MRATASDKTGHVRDQFVVRAIGIATVVGGVIPDITGATYYAVVVKIYIP